MPYKKSTVHSMVTPEGIPTTVYNRVTQSSDDFYISYNNYDTDIYGDKTTALVYSDRKSTWFYILNGDHTDEYESIQPFTFLGCLSYFLSNLDKMNHMSDKIMSTNIKIMMEEIRARNNSQ